ncbi:MAG: T9SS type A sorting domain-containing protein [Bacteroidetes bacterium]|nr:T9SS type A sorting domain-containing protein [Bacteroidota bacterium]
MKRILNGILLLISFNLAAHDINQSNLMQKEWIIKGNKTSFKGNFLVMKENMVNIETIEGKVIAIPFEKLSLNDQTFIQKRIEKIKTINRQLLQRNKTLESNQSIIDTKTALIFIFLISLLFGIVYKFRKQEIFKYLIPVPAVGLIIFISSFTHKAMKSMQVTTSVTFMDSAFAPFKPNVYTRYDANYFYVESKGVPTTHGMMAGISNHGWQQQVPIPQCYTGTNPWSIPLHPEIAATPVPADASHFLRGALALAINGIPIFNVYTNTGVDSYVDGQLDNFGGHCGRADDYHYHLPPLHLYNYTDAKLPIAFALDGFAVYGSKEPDGTNMNTLDANHGHYFSGVYHYHGTSRAPYMVGSMVGKVTEDNTLQIIPQAAAKPVRNENWTPLKGALITSCTSNASNNGYNLSYTLNDTIGYATNFSWTTAGKYKFDYVTPKGTTSKTYNGFVQCSLPLSIKNSLYDSYFSISPVPASQSINIIINNQLRDSEINGIKIFNINGQVVYTANKFLSSIDVKSYLNGLYFVQISTTKGDIYKKIIIQK